MTRITKFVFFCALTLVGNMSYLLGQAATASLSGVMTDTTGASIPQATVTAKNNGTGASRSTMSDGQGRYSLPDLAIGDYDVTGTKTGFQTVVRKGVNLTVGASPIADFQLPVGQAEQTVNVEGTISQVETETSSVSSLMSQVQVRELPLNGRNFEQLILLAPGAISYPAGGSSALVGRAATFSISGARPEGHAILLDGENLQDWWQRGSGANVSGTSLGIEAIAEFQTLTNTYSAEYGGNGSVVNAVSKSGANQFHGTAFDFLRNSAMDARSFFETRINSGDTAAKPAPFRKNQYGGSFGGPIIKEKVFFFANYEGIRQALFQSFLVFVPDDNARNGIINGVNVNGAGVAVPASVAGIIALYPHATNVTGGGIGSTTTVANQVIHEDYLILRGDWTISNKDSMFVRYVQDNALALSPTAINYWPVTDNNYNKFVTIQERHIFSPTLLNQFSVSFSRPYETETEPGVAPGNVLQAFPGRQDVTIGITALTSLGANFTNPFRFLENKFTETDSLIWTKGSHTFKMGIEVRRHQLNGDANTYWNGNYTFPSLTAFLQGKPSLFSGAPPATANGYRYFRDIGLKPYIQDDWKINRKLTLNIGIRYEFQTNPVETRNVLTNIVNPPFGTGFSSVPNAFATNPNTRNWDPRVGLAYDVFGDHKTSMRAGFGMFHDPAQTYVFNSGYVGTPPFLALNSVNPSFPLPFVGGGAASAPLPALTFGTDYNIHTTPYMMQYNLNIEREVAKGSVVTLGYVGSRGVDLLSFRDYNPPVPAKLANGTLQFGNPTTGVSNPRINPLFGSLVLTNPGSSSHYNSFQSSWNNRLGNNFVGNFSYVYSRCTDGAYTYGGLGGNNGTSSWTNPYDGTRERGLCGFDIRHNMSLNVVYKLPFRGNRLKEGWQVSGIEVFRTGVPISIGVGYDRALLSNNFSSQRPDVIAGCDQTGGVGHTPQHWYNPACYTLPAAGTVGNLGKNTVEGANYQTVDFSLSKDTKIFERINTQFRAEIFNILNHTNLSTPGFLGGNLNAFSAVGGLAGAAAGSASNVANAGAIGGIIGTSRQIQLGLKFIF